MNYIFTKETLTLAFDGKHFVINKSEKPREYTTLLKAVKDKTLTKELVIQTLDLVANINTKLTGTSLKLDEVTGCIIDSDNSQVPRFLSNRILEFHKEQLPFEHLLKFWENVKLNPSFRSREQLYEFLERKGHPITEDGCFIAYRGVTKDFKDKHTRKFDNSVGSICSMNRSQVDDDPSRTCSHGLHVAAFNYAKGFGEQLVEVKVNPADVVAIPLDYNGEKMRVCKFEVVNVCENERNNESLYGRENTDMESYFEGNEMLGEDEEYDKDLIDAIEDYRNEGFEGTALVYRILAEFPEKTYEEISELIYG